MLCAENASFYFDPSALDKIAGRCARIGMDDSTAQMGYYHWAIARDKKENTLYVDHFWDTEIWTTERYRTERM